MFNTLKVAQAEKQIYPQSCGKVKKAKSGEKAERSDFAGGWNRSCNLPRRPVRRGDHQNDRREDDRGGNDGAQLDGLPGHQPAQAHEAITSTAARRGSTRSEPPRCAGPTSSASPANPIRSPIATLGTGFTPPGRSQSTITSQSDTVATRSAAIPEGTVCSAQLTPPLPTNSSKVPVMTAATQLAAVGLIPVLTRRTG